MDVVMVVDKVSVVVSVVLNVRDVVTVVGLGT